MSRPISVRKDFFPERFSALRASLTGLKDISSRIRRENGRTNRYSISPTKHRFCVTLIHMGKQRNLKQNWRRILTLSMFSVSSANLANNAQIRERGCANIISVSPTSNIFHQSGPKPCKDSSYEISRIAGGLWCQREGGIAVAASLAVRISL